MTTAAQLLGAAERMLGEDGSRAKVAWARGAALLTRQAIEGSLTELWSQRSPGVMTCPAKVQLICLTAAGVGPEVARQVRHAWSRLSAACHHHPYDVAPSIEELRQWICVAGKLDESARAGANS